jgi:hypothetical protein
LLKTLTEFSSVAIHKAGIGRRHSVLAAVGG